MPGRDHPGPHYISAAEYARVRRTKTRRWSAVALVLAASAIVLGVWAIRIPRLRSAEQLLAASVAARSPIDLQAEVWTSKDQRWVRYCTEWSTRDQTRLEFEDTGIVVVKGHTEDTVWDPGAGELRYHVFDKYAPDVRAWIASCFYRASIRKDLERFPAARVEGRSVNRYRYVDGAERYTLSVEEETDQPAGVLLERRTADGWVGAVNVRAKVGVKMAPNLFAQEPSGPFVKVDLRGDHDPRKALQEPVASVPIGPESAIKIAAAEVNREGTVFVVFHTRQPVVPPFVTDDRGMVYFRRSLPSYQEIPAASFMFVPQIADAGGFASRTIQVHFPTQGVSSGRLPPRDLGVFSMCVDAPTCTLAPRYLQGAMDADQQVQFDAEVSRGQHLETAMRFSDGTLADISDLRGRPLPEGYDSKDRRDAMEAYLRALQIHRTSRALGAPGTAFIWFSLYKLERVHGDSDLATAYLASAVARVQEGETGPGAEEIFAEWRQRQRPSAGPR
ncbi:MAG: hypothetical protein M9921_12790 [Fimbriimonadaceae bacterium]|nr:hypothetical protein [Chthonomonadaceae bacterium]MCO5297725.1 hypothetical protein [Fimbriimonadaceae bacterium]